MLAFLLLLFLSPLCIHGQIEPLYTTLPGGGGLVYTTSGSYLITSSSLDRDFIRCSDRTVIGDLPPEAYLGSLTILTDSLVLAAGTYVIDLSTSSTLDTLLFDSKRFKTCVSPDRRRVVQLLDSGRVIVWSVDDREIEYDQRHLGYDTAYFSTSNDHILISGTLSGTGTMPLLLVELSAPFKTRSFDRTDVYGCLLPNADVLYTTTRAGKLNVWDLRADTLIGTSMEFYAVATGSLEVRTFTIDATGKTIVVSGTRTAFYDVSSLGHIRTYESRVLRVSDDRARAALIDAGGLLRLVDLETGEQRDSMNLSPVSLPALNVTLTSDLGLVAKLGDHSVVAYDVPTKNSRWTIDRVGPRFYDVSLGDDIILTSPKHHVYSARTGKVMYRLSDFSDLVDFASYSEYDEHTDRFMHAKSGGFRFIDPATSSELFVRASTNGYNGFRLAKRGEVIFDYSAHLNAYSTRNGELLWSDLDGHTVRHDTSMYVGDDLIVAYEGPDWLIVDIQDGRIVQKIDPAAIPTVFGVMFTNDPTRIIIRDSKSTFLLWDVTQAVAIDTIHDANQADLLEGSIVRFVLEDGTSAFYDVRDQSLRTGFPLLGSWPAPVLSGDVLVVADQGKYRFFEYSTGRELLSIPHIKQHLRFAQFDYDAESGHFITEHGSLGPFSVYDLKDHIVTSIPDEKGEDAADQLIEVALFPNPLRTSTCISVRFGSTDLQKVQVVDLTGRVVRIFYGDGSLSSQQFYLDDRNLPHGIHFVQATDRTGSYTSTLAH